MCSRPTGAGKSHAKRKVIQMPEDNFAEAAEVAIEAVTENAHEHGALPPWVEWASLSTMVMALFAAVGGFMASSTDEEALVDGQKQLADLVTLSRMEMRSQLLLNRLAVIESTGRNADQSLLDEIQAANKAATDSTKRASEEVAESGALLQTNELFSVGTTILSVAITLTGMAVIVRQQRLWFGGIGISVVGAGFVLYSLVKTLVS